MKNLSDLIKSVSSVQYANDIIVAWIDFKNPEFQSINNDSKIQLWKKWTTECAMLFYDDFIVLWELLRFRKLEGFNIFIDAIEEVMEVAVLGFWSPIIDDIDLYCKLLNTINRYKVGAFNVNIKDLYHKVNLENDIRGSFAYLNELRYRLVITEGKLLGLKSEGIEVGFEFYKLERTKHIIDFQLEYFKNLIILNQTESEHIISSNGANLIEKKPPTKIIDEDRTLENAQNAIALAHYYLSLVNDLEGIPQKEKALKIAAEYYPIFLGRKSSPNSYRKILTSYEHYSVHINNRIQPLLYQKKSARALLMTFKGALLILEYKRNDAAIAAINEEFLLFYKRNEKLLFKKDYPLSPQ